MSAKLSKVEKIRKLLATNMSVKTIAEKVGSSPNYVYYVKWNDKKAKTGSKPKTKKTAKKTKPLNNIYSELLQQRAKDEAELVQIQQDELRSSLGVNDNVNHPPHYTLGGIETIDFIEAKRLNYNRGNALKYLTRAGFKNGMTEIEDLKKAEWYLTREIDRLEANV